MLISRDKIKSWIRLHLSGVNNTNHFHSESGTASATVTTSVRTITCISHIYVQFRSVPDELISRRLSPAVKLLIFFLLWNSNIIRRILVLYKRTITITALKQDIQKSTLVANIALIYYIKENTKSYLSGLVDLQTVLFFRRSLLFVTNFVNN